MAVSQPGFGGQHGPDYPPVTYDIEVYRNMLIKKSEINKSTVELEIEKYKIQNRSVPAHRINNLVNDLKFNDTSLIRVRGDEVKINNMIIDYFLHYYNSLNSLYTNPEKTEETLSDLFKIKSNTTVEERGGEKVSLERVRETKKKETIRQAHQYWDFRKSPNLYSIGMEAKDKFQKTIQVLIDEIGVSNITSQVDRWIHKRIETLNSQSINNAILKLRLIKLNRYVEFRDLVLQEFQPGKRYTKEEINTKMSNLRQIVQEANEHVNFQPTPSQYQTYYSAMFKTKRFGKGNNKFEIVEFYKVEDVFA